MNSIADAMHASHDNHTAALVGAHAVGEGFASRAMRSVKRRKALRATGYGGVSVLAAGALGTAWWLMPGVRLAAPAAPAPSSTCGAILYLPPNPASLGYAPFVFRAYVDLRKESPDPKVVVVLANGAATRILPNADGDYVYSVGVQQFPLFMHDWSDSLRSQPVVSDYFADGTGGGAVWDGHSPEVRDYAWTTVVPAGAPVGLNPLSLSWTLRTAIGMGGVGYLSESVPPGAVTDAVVTTTSGTEVTRMHEGDAMPNIEGRNDVVSVALRVSGLAGGKTFSIVSTYDPAGIPRHACAAAPPVAVTPAPVASTVGPTAIPFGSSPAPSPTSAVSATPAPSAG